MAASIRNDHRKHGNKTPLRAYVRSILAAHRPADTDYPASLRWSSANSWATRKGLTR